MSRGMMELRGAKPRLTTKENAITPFNATFGELVVFWFKWLFAAIPALIAVSGIALLVRLWTSG